MTWTTTLRMLRLNWFKLLSASLLGGLLGIVGVIVVSSVFGRPPIIIQDLRGLDTVTIRGSWLRIHARFRTNLGCEQQVNRFLWQWTGEPGRSDRRWVMLSSAGSPPAEVGAVTSYEVDFRVPGDLAAGQWYYRATIRADCNWRDWLHGGSVHSTGDVPVEIVDPPENAPAQIVAPRGPVTILPQAGR